MTHNNVFSRLSFRQSVQRYVYERRLGMFVALCVAVLLQAAVYTSSGSFLLSAQAVVVSNKDSPPPALQPGAPVIGVVTTAMPDCIGKGAKVPKDVSFKPTSCAEGYTLRWLQAQGLRVLPIPWDATDERRQYLLERVNGVVFPGGMLSSFPDAEAEYVAKTSKIIDYARDHPDFLVFGICQGFQIMSIILAGNDEGICPCIYKGTMGAMLPLDFTTAQSKSIMFGSGESALGSRYKDEIVDTLASKSTTLNLHSCGIAPDVFRSGPLANRVTLLSTNVDDNGLSFGSSWESSEGLNMFAIQFHPEHVPFQFNGLPSEVYTTASVNVATYFARFVRERAMRNNHSFENGAEIDELVTDNHYRVSQGYGFIMYWFDF